jgi:hypothetical protein
MATPILRSWTPFSLRPTHLGSRRRDAAALKEDVAAYRERVPDVRFRSEHQFAEGGYLATRLTATAGGQTICGLNISRWENVVPR